MYLPMLAVHEPAIYEQFKSYHRHENHGDGDLGVNRMKNHDRSMNGELPESWYPAFIQFFNELMK